MNGFVKHTLLFAAALTGIFLLFVWYITPQRSGHRQMPHLRKEVKVSFDTYGIPHIFAASQKDAFMAFGYVHAADRLFQMELLRRIAKGELAEIFGKELLPIDRYFRTLSVFETAKSQWEKVDKESDYIKVATSYAKGINTFILEGTLPIEFGLLGYKPKPFTVLDIYAIMNYMGTTFGNGLKTDLMMTAARDKVGDKMLQDLDFAPTSKGGPLSAQLAPIKAAKALKGLAFVDEVMGEVGRFDGSNAFLVPKSRSESGFPILANDTHMKFSNPPVWYEAQISYPGYDVYGHFMAGSPFPILGHTREFGWGITIFLADTMDVVADEKDPEKENYVKRKEGSRPLSIRQETIKVKDGPEENFQVLSSDIGPIINGLFPDLAPKDTYLSLSTTLLPKDGNPLKNIYDLGHATSMEKFKQVAQKSISPSLNLFYAHKTQGVAFIGAGAVRKQTPDLSEYFIQKQKDFSPQFLSADEKPSMIKPQKEIVKNANHHPEGDITYSGYYPYPARINRLKTLLASKEKWSLEDLKAVQTDTNIPYFQPFKKILKEILPSLADKEKIYAERLLSWDGEAKASSSEATLFYEWLSIAITDMAHRHLGKDLGNEYVKSYVSLRSVMKLLEQKDSLWWDFPMTNRKERRNDALRAAFVQAAEYLKIKFGPQMEDWAWGKMHTLTLNHPLSRVSPLDLVFNIGPSRASGGLDSVNTYAFSLLPGHKKVTAGAATRRLIDFSQPEKALGVLPGGQSGLLVDRHYKDQWQLFLDHRYRDAQIWAHPRAHALILSPQKTGT